MDERRIKNSDKRSAEVIKRTVWVDFPSVAEVGVYRGFMSKRLVLHPNLMLTMVDSWGEHVADSYKATGDEFASHSMEEWEDVKAESLSGIDWAKDRVRVYQGTSQGAADYYAEELFDVVFIDADHSYESTKADIEAWWGMVVPGGYIGGHDYFDTPNFGVITAVDEFIAKNEGLELELGENKTWFVRKPA